MTSNRFKTAAAVIVVAGVACTGTQALASTRQDAADKKQPTAAASGKRAGAVEGPSAKAQAQLAKLPAAVRATVDAETKNATIKSVSSEKEHGQTVYELESLVNGRTRDLMIDAAGKVYVVEEQLDVDKAPAPVRAALQAQGTVRTLESVTENGKTHYEGQVVTKSGKKISLDLEPDGAPVKK